MKFWNVTTPPAVRIAGGFAGIGMLMLAAMSAPNVNAEEDSKSAVDVQSKHPAQVSKHAHAAKTDTASKPDAVAKSDAAAKPEATSKPDAASKAKARAAVNLGVAECVRTGQRVIAALARDDSGAASQFHTFYTAFKCSPQHLAQAFGCLVNLQKANPGLSSPSPEQVSQCWENPEETPKVQPQPAAEGAGQKN